MNKVEILNIVEHYVSGRLFLYVWLTDGIVHIWGVDLNIAFDSFTIEIYKDLIHFYYE